MSAHPALVLIDLQKAIDHPSWGVRNHPHAERRLQRLLYIWRQMEWPLFHVRHDSLEEGSTYRPGQPLHAFKPETAPENGETVLGKTTCSAFASTDLGERLRTAGAPAVFVGGVITNNSVEATVRAGKDLGFRMYLVEDGCFTFGKGRWAAQDVHDMSVANLEGEYATITTSGKVVTTFLENVFADGRMGGALRAAAAANYGNAGEDSVLACLLRDLPGMFGREAVRRLGFPEHVAALVEERERTLRYLAAQGGETLTEEEWAVVRRLGGPMSEMEAEVFGDRSQSFTSLRIRYFEEQARRMHGPVPDFGHYRGLVERHLQDGQPG